MSEKVEGGDSFESDTKFTMFNISIKHFSSNLKAVHTSFSSDKTGTKRKFWRGIHYGNRDKKQNFTKIDTAGWYSTYAWVDWLSKNILSLYSFLWILMFYDSRTDTSVLQNDISLLTVNFVIYQMTVSLGCK